jgi:glucokinase
MDKTVIGVDIGGSHIACAAIDVEEKKYMDETFSESGLDNQASSEEIMTIWGNTIRECMEKAEPNQTSGITFAMPGPFDYVKGIPLFKGEVKKYQGIYGINVPDVLREFLKLPSAFPVRFINDATAFALGEDWIGGAKGFKRSLSITLGTGFGSAFLQDSLPVLTGDKVPAQGCIWHLPFEGGMADDYFSTRGLTGRYRQLTGREVSGVKEIAHDAIDDPDARELFSDFGRKLIMLLSPWLTRFGVEILVVGGNISRAYHLFGPAMEEQRVKEKLDIKVRISELHEKAAITGSARLADNSFWDHVFPSLKYM